MRLYPKKIHKIRANNRNRGPDVTNNLLQRLLWKYYLRRFWLTGNPSNAIIFKAFVVGLGPGRN